MSAATLPPVAERDWLTIEEAAAEAAVSARTVQGWLSSGHKPIRGGQRVFLSASRPGARVRIEKADLAAFLAAIKSGATRPPLPDSPAAGRKKTSAAAKRMAARLNR